jgi:nucleotide-binding universal stress UspA family protein
MTGDRSNPLFRRILVGYDGSEQAEKAVGVAISLARCMTATVLVFAVARPSEPATDVELEAVLDDAREHYETGFAKIRENASADIELRTEIAVGHPAQQIVHKAEAESIDLIVLGGRGTSMFHKLLLGSTSDRVLRYAHCPVMIVR